MPYVHYRTNTTVTRTNGQPETMTPLGIDPGEQYARALAAVSATKRNGWPVVVQVTESYVRCTKADAGNHCGHCNHDEPVKEFSAAQCRANGTGYPAPRVVRQELFRCPADVRTVTP